MHKSFRLSDLIVTGLPYRDHQEEEDNPLALRLGCSAKLAVRMSARVEGEVPSKPSSEDVYRARLSLETNARV